MRNLVKGAEDTEEKEIAHQIYSSRKRSAGTNESINQSMR